LATRPSSILDGAPNAPQHQDTRTLGVVFNVIENLLLGVCILLEQTERPD
jgi:hypothetical protein